LVLRDPIVRNIVGAGRGGHGSVQVKWQQLPDRRIRGVGRISLLKRQTLVGETAHSPIASEIMIEGSIFLDEDDHMIDIGQFTAAAGGSWGGGRAGTSAD